MKKTTKAVLTQKTLNLLQEKQKNLDIFIHQQNKLEMKDTFYLRKIALFVEIGEVANELKTFNLANSARIDFIAYRFQNFLSEGEFALNNLLLSLFERTKKLNLPRPRKIKGQKPGKLGQKRTSLIGHYEYLAQELRIEYVPISNQYMSK
ncbi:12926_t:CDS:2 [Entrophospora sp. SA101]|nr:15423_t:CDS:2 [Entrophospora sp. SA101]CAJ0747022.1 12926_t:CDS:2 [Entrophospora sp. SA101]